MRQLDPLELARLLANHAEKRSDYVLKRYVQPNGRRGQHIVEPRCGGQRERVAGPPDQTFRPGSIVAVGSHLGASGPQIFSYPPPAGRGSSRFAQTPTPGRLNAPACPRALTGHEYLALFVVGTSLYSAVYRDGTWNRAVFGPVAIPAGYAFSNGYDNAVAKSGTRLAWLAKHSASNDAAVMVWDCDEGGTGAISANRVTGVPWVDTTREVVEAGGAWKFGYLVQPADQPLRVYTAPIGGGAASLESSLTLSSDRYSINDLLQFGSSWEIVGWDFNTPGVGSTYALVFYPNGASLQTQGARTALKPDTLGSGLAGRPAGGGSARYNPVAYGTGAGERGALALWAVGGSERALSPQAWNLATNAAPISPSPSGVEVAIYPVWQYGAVSGNGKLLRLTLEDRTNEAFDDVACDPPWIVVSNHPTLATAPKALLCRD